MMYLLNFLYCHSILLCKDNFMTFCIFSNSTKVIKSDIAMTIIRLALITLSCWLLPSVLRIVLNKHVFDTNLYRNFLSICKIVLEGLHWQNEIEKDEHEFTCRNDYFIFCYFFGILIHTEKLFNVLIIDLHTFK